MNGSFEFDVFVSHNSADKLRARELAEKLRTAGLRVWFDEWVIRPGDDIFLSIERGLNDSRVLILCMTANAFRSDWVGLERSTVLFRDPSNKGRRFVPLLMEACEIPDTLRRYAFIDYRNDEGDALDKLVASCWEISEEKLAQSLPRQRSSSQAKKWVGAQLAVFQQNLEGHKGQVRTIAIAPNGAWAASGSVDCTIRMWDLQTGQCRGVLLGHRGQINSVVISKDGSKIFSAANDASIRIWDAATGQSKGSLNWKYGMVLSIAAFEDSDKIIAAGSFDHKAGVKIFDAINKTQLMDFDTQHSLPTSVAVTSDQRKVAGGLFDETIRIWDRGLLEYLSIMRGHSGRVRSICFSPDGRRLISASDDATIKIWDVRTSDCIGTLEGHGGHVYSVCVSSDGQTLASAGFADNTVRIWDLESGVCLQVLDFRDTANQPRTVSFNREGTQLFVGFTEGTIYAYRLNLRAPALKIAPARRYTNAKIVLIGESGAGKTTLAQRLIHDSYIKTDSTHGMNVWRLDLPLTNDERSEREALLWDFAGQEDYRLIHRLFLAQTALALLLVNPQKDDPFAEAGDWLKGLSAIVSGDREVTKLLIPTRADVGGLKISNQKVDQFCKDNGFTTWLETSALRGDNCSDKQNQGVSKLKELIAANIPWDKLPWTSTPELLGKIKNAIIALQAEGDIRLLRFAELSDRLEKALPEDLIGESDIRTAVTLLANHGLVHVLNFGDLVLLRPDLLNAYASALIRAARAHTDEIGCLAEELIYTDSVDFTGVDRLENRADEELLLRAVVKTLLDHSLCIREAEDGQMLLIFPSQYRRDRAIPTHPEVFVAYTFTGELQSIYTTLVVRLWHSGRFDRKQLWANAAELKTVRGKTLGILFEKLGDGAGKLSIFFEQEVPDETQVAFVEFIHRHLTKYGRDLQRERRYACSECGQLVTDHNMVRKRLASGKNFITCQACDAQVDLIDLIERRLASDPVARQVIEMDQQATAALDTQALEQLLLGHMLATCAEANQIFRPVTLFDFGIDGEIEFKSDNGAASGKKIYVQLKSGDSFLRVRRSDGQEIFDVKNLRHLDYWINQPADVFLVIRNSEDGIRWMNITRYLKNRKDKRSKQIIFSGEKLDFAAVWRVRDFYIPGSGVGARAITCA
ncbi:TIR domain-containing protein [Methylocystis rosea]|uniref:TIR domain-containing protein n=1 Tax=Methylocystis rosea TaxID=173366 RepID=A0ABX6EHW0_9HYPH|nr:TIR domain-containing protein [Methylocystis rosea]QGM93442.1 TIR domain-containing protein [Methylocystis rosea]